MGGRTHQIRILVCRTKSVLYSVIAKLSGVFTRKANRSLETKHCALSIAYAQGALNWRVSKSVC
jgi:hypothetical protein